MTLTLLGTAKSRAFRPLWLLEELGLEFRHQPAPPRSAEVRAANPTGKVPVLLDGDLAVRDSTAILHYLADRHGGLTHPAGSPARARQDAWTFRILDELDAVLWTAARHSFILPEAERVAAIKPALKAEFARNLARISAEIEGPFLMGETMTLPDILLVHCGGWAKIARFDAAPEAFRAYARELRARPAYQRAAARD
ncbi:glutathione S-transferase family protein [Roseivivax sp. CAU 1761]